MKGKIKTTRAATTVNKAPSKPKKTYTTAGGAQQYVRGNTYDERSDNVLKAKKSALYQPEFNKALSNSLGAVGSAQQSREIKAIVGPKKAKTNSSVRMYDRMEREDMARAKPKPKKQ
jgi:hypothetical protein